MITFDDTGQVVVDLVLAAAGVLRDEGTPGLVVIVLLVALAFCMLRLSIIVRGRRRALQWLTAIVSETRDISDFSDRIAEIDQKVVQQRRRGDAHGSVAEAWDEYRETILVDERDGRPVLRNAVRPGVFFNIEDLHFGPGFWRIMPGLFVTIGLFLTFLGLISALDTMGDQMRPAGSGQQAGNMQQSMQTLLTVASAKFIMSLTGLLCSIVFTIWLRWGMANVESAINGLNRDLEKRLSFISLEDLSMAQLAATREQREHFRSIGLELVAELGRPLREELPQAISGSINTAMAPLLEQVGRMSTEGVGGMVKDLSARMSEDVGRTLLEVSGRLTEAGDRMGALVDRMDQSSGRMGNEMGGAVERLGQALEGIRASMSDGAQATRGAFQEGAESILTAMEKSLDGIRENTGAGAEAMRAAAADMRVAAEGIRAELAAASQESAAAMRDRVGAASQEASASIERAGGTILDAFGRTSVEIARIAEEMADKAGNDLLAPMQALSVELNQMVSALSDGATQVRRASDGMRVGADATVEAAGTFRGSAEAIASATDPVRATVERLEGSTRHLAESTRSVADSARSSAESAARALDAAKEALGGEQRSLEASLAILGNAVERMRGQGDRLDDMDEKLGRAFEEYQKQVETAVGSLFDHVRKMLDILNPAIDTMRDVVDQAERFAPQHARTA